MLLRLLKTVPVLLAICIFQPIKAGAEIELPMTLSSQPIQLYDGSSRYGEFDDMNQDEAKEAEKSGPKISKTKAVLLSLLLPGAGHYYLDHKGRGQIFLGVEAASWFGFIAFRTYGGWKEDDYKRYAIKYAGITPSGHDETFYRNLIFYESRDEYNSSGRIINPGAQYYPNEPRYDWYWDSTAHRQQYRTIRNDSEVAYRKATFMLGLAIFNRIVAGIDAFRIAQREASRIQDNDFLSSHNLKIRLKADPFGDNPDFGITITHRF